MNFENGCGLCSDCYKEKQKMKQRIKNNIGKHMMLWTGIAITIFVVAGMFMEGIGYGIGTTLFATFVWGAIIRMMD